MNIGAALSMFPGPMNVHFLLVCCEESITLSRAVLLSRSAGNAHAEHTCSNFAKFRHGSRKRHGTAPRQHTRFREGSSADWQDLESAARSMKSRKAKTYPLNAVSLVHWDREPRKRRTNEVPDERTSCQSTICMAHVQVLNVYRCRHPDEIHPAAKNHFGCFSNCPVEKMV